jgi:putative DNA primase/helicase
MDVDKDFDKEFGRVKSSKPNASQIIEEASEQIMKDHTFITIEETGEILYYDNGVYVPGGDILIAKECEKMFNYDLNTERLSQIKGHIMRRTYHKHEELDADTNIINLKNGLYDIDNDILKDHTPDYLSINQKPITYIRGAKPERFGSFLYEVLYPRNVRTAVEAMAYTFHRDYDIAETIFILLGIGNNGKSVYTSTLTALHGPDNVSNVPLSEILGDRFALSDMENKDINIDNELTRQNIKETAVLKRLTGGSRQRIRIQRKNQRAYDVTLYTKLFFNANELPDSNDRSYAYSRRVMLISFPYMFEGTTADKQLISKLTTEEEKSGIFNILMIALRRIRKTKDIYADEKTIEEKRIKYERSVNPVSVFCEEAIAENSVLDDYVPKIQFHEAYQTYCKKYSLPIEKYDNFCKIVKNRIDLETTKKKDLKGNRVNCWKGIKLTSEYAPKTEQTTLLDLEEADLLR